MIEAAGQRSRLAGHGRLFAVVGLGLAVAAVVSAATGAVTGYIAIWGDPSEDAPAVAGFGLMLFVLAGALAFFAHRLIAGPLAEPQQDTERPAAQRLPLVARLLAAPAALALFVVGLYASLWAYIGWRFAVVALPISTVVLGIFAAAAVFLAASIRGTLPRVFRSRAGTAFIGLWVLAAASLVLMVAIGAASDGY